MGAVRTARARLRRAVPAVVAAGLVPAVLAGGAGPTAAAQHRAGPGGGADRRGVMTAGDIYDLAGGAAGGFSGGGGPATRAGLFHPVGAAVDAAGNVVIADTGESRVLVVAASTGTFYGKRMTARRIYSVAGDGSQGDFGNASPATRARLDLPDGVAVDAAGNLLIADTFSNRIRVVADSTGTFYGQPMTAGDIYSVAGIAPGGRGYSGDGGPAIQARLQLPSAVATDAAGNLLIADSSNQRIRVVADSTGTFYGQPMTAGDIYSVAGNGKKGHSGDGGPATNAMLLFPRGVAADAAGNLLIADSGNNRIRVVAGSTGIFYGKRMAAGDIYTLAGTREGGYSGDGGPATSAELALPQGLAVDAAGNLLIADTYNQRIRVVARSTGTFYGQPMTAGDIYTIAGTGKQGFSGDRGPATKATFDYPSSVAADAVGNLLIADFANNRIRVVAG